MDPRKIINATIIVLALLVLGLTLEETREAYVGYRAAGEVEHANELADNLIRAAGIEAMERGLTSTALGAHGPADASTRTKIADLRRNGDAEWRRALGLAESLANELPYTVDFAAAIEQVQQRRQSLEQVRSRVDGCLNTRSCDIQVEEWLDAITRFITANARLREAAFLPLDAPRHVTQLNLSLKRWVWLASEHAGRERGILAYYLSARRPLPPAQWDELKANRGVVERNILDIQVLKELRSTDPRITQAIRGMEEHFLRRFDAVRQQAYAGAAKGDYALSGEEWVAQATGAINSILAVAAAVTQVADEQARAAMQESTRRVLWHLSALMVALVLGGIGLIKVRQTANSLFHQKELAEVTLHSIGDAVITTDAGARVEYLNPVAEELTGWTTREARGLPLQQVFHIANGLTREPEPNPIEECLREGKVVGLASNTVLVRRDGREFAIEDSAAPIRDREGITVGGVLVFYDVTQMRHMPHLLSYHATHDALTGLVNRREFERRLSELLVRARNQDERHALCYVDLDQFKVINDTCGHAVGDRLLRQLTASLQDRVRDSDTLARLGGDEFGILLDGCQLDRALQVADSLRQVVKEFRLVHEGRTIELSASVGLVLISAASDTVVEILKEADAACYIAKEKGGNRVQVYQHGDLDLARREGEMRWVSRINQALEENRFVLYCQKIAPLDGARGRHCEILLRLLDEEGRLVSPQAFIPAAERYNLMPGVDRWVIRNGLAAIGQYLRDNPGRSDEMCSINLSGASLGDEHFEGYVREQLALHRVPPHLVCFEITETAAVANLDQAAALIKALKAEGCRFALDDFGSGLSSFMYLKLLPVDYLKIDGAFVKDMVNDPVASAMVQAINTVGHVMDIKTIAEYAENDAILERLRELGVDYAQGYGIGKPEPMGQC